MKQEAKDIESPHGMFYVIDTCFSALRGTCYLPVEARPPTSSISESTAAASDGLNRNGHWSPTRPKKLTALPPCLPCPHL